jgi:hypothetical protein
LPYDATGANAAARLTIDVGAGDRFLIDLDRKATSDWLNTSNPVLDYANALVPSKQPPSASSAEGNWQEHVDGKSNFAPPILPLAPAKFTGSLYITSGHNPLPECTTFSRAQRRRHNLWHAGLYVLGSRVPFHQESLHHATQYLPGRRRHRRPDVQHSSTHARVAATVGARSGSTRTKVET